jgi:hypothetical protein
MFSENKFDRSNVTDMQSIPTVPSVVYASPTQAQQNQYVTSTPAHHQQQQQVPSVAVTPIHGEPKHGPKTQVIRQLI